MNEPKKPDPGHTSIRLGPAFLRPSAMEKDHYELCRPILTVSNEGDRVTTEAHPEAVPLGLYRAKRRGDKMPTMAEAAGHRGPPQEIRTADQKGQPMTLILVKWLGEG